MLAGHLARERWGLHVAEGLSDPWQLSPPQSETGLPWGRGHGDHAR